MSDSLVLKAEGLSLGYRGRDVLSAVDWEVRAGEFWCVLGPNGAGKSTLLRAVLGLQAARTGRLTLAREHTGRERIGFVPQTCTMNPTLPTTVREFTTLGLVGFRVDRKETAARLEEALGHTGLRGMADVRYAELSGGQRQRVLVARALIRRPALLILDEPTVGLDARSTETFLEAVAHLSHHGTTILFVTHRLEIAARHASHVVLVSRGTARAGPVDVVLADPEAEQALGPGASVWETLREGMPT